MLDGDAGFQLEAGFEGDAGLRVGTSSWSSKDWVGGFYPRRTPPNQFIRHYSTVYDTVEIDATFYAMPSDAQVSAWKRRTPEGFLFSAKTPRVITHDKILEGADEDMEIFVETMAGLGDRLGPLLLQFPYFNKTIFESSRPFLDRLDRFLERLAKGPRYVVEIRNPSWLGDELAEVCRRHEVCLAWIAKAWMPRPEEWLRRLRASTSDFAYVRFLGDHRGIEKITKSWDRLVVDPGDELDVWIPIIRELRETGTDVFAYFNNHFAGNAPQTIELFRNRWRLAHGRPPLAEKPALEEKALEENLAAPRSSPRRPSEQPPPEQLDLPF